MRVALVAAGMVANVAEFDTLQRAVDLFPAYTCVDVTALDCGPGWSYDGSTFTAPVVPSAPHQGWKTPLYMSQGDKLIQNTTVETSSGSPSARGSALLPADFITPTRLIEFKQFGVVSTGASPVTLTARLKRDLQPSGELEQRLLGAGREDHGPDPGAGWFFGGGHDFERPGECLDHPGPSDREHSAEQPARLDFPVGRGGCREQAPGLRDLPRSDHLMLLNGSVINAVALNGSSGPGQISLSASAGLSQGLAGTMAYGIRLSVTVQEAQGLTGNISALLVGTVSQSQGLAGTPRALLVGNPRHSMGLTPQLYAWSTATFSQSQGLQGTMRMLLSGALGGAQGLSGSMGITKPMTASFSQSFGLVGFMAGVWNSSFGSSFSVSGTLTMRMFFQGSVGTVQTLAGILHAQIIATLSHNQTFSATMGVYTPIVVTFTNTQSLSGTPWALLSKSFLNAQNLTGNITTRIFKTGSFVMVQEIVPALYRYQQPTSLNSMFAVHCHIQLLGSGRKLSGKIARDVQIPYIDQMVS
jgi:hypothetical protein